MTSRALVRVDADTLERIARNSGHPIELATNQAFLTVGATTFVADIPAVDGAA